jgi:hypothetical protein
LPLGFTRARASVQAKVERRFLSLPSAPIIRDAHRVLTDKPHMAGTARDRELAEWTRDRFQNAGLEEVAITTHDVLLPWPLEVNVEMTAPRRWRASMREEPVTGDAHPSPEPADGTLPYHAYSASGDVTAPAVYAGNGTPEDYDWLSAQGIDVRSTTSPMPGASRSSRRRWNGDGTVFPEQTRLRPWRMSVTPQPNADRRSAFNDRREAALRESDGSGFEPLNRQLLSIERALLDADGLLGRPWYRHLIYAPRFTYAPEVLPGVSEAIEAGDGGRALD